MENIVVDWDKMWMRLMDFGDRVGCRQIANRSFFINGYQFPVCARCTGVIVGEIVAVLLILLRINIDFIWAVTLLLVMGADWFLQYINWIKSNNTRRMITGISGGLGLTYLYYGIFVFIFVILKNFVFRYIFN
ncbi:MAG: DUF2085 domain-containing protein [Acutalibacteraceae bacterium]